MFRPKNSCRHIFISVYQCIVSKINFTLLNLDKKNLISWEYLSWVSGWHHSRSSFCRYSDQLPHKSSSFQVGNFLVMNLIPLTVITGLNYSIYNTIKRYIYSPFLPIPLVVKYQTYALSVITLFCIWNITEQIYLITLHLTLEKGQWKQTYAVITLFWIEPSKYFNWKKGQ